MGKTKTLNFRVGSNFGKLITDIAQEHTFMGDFNIIKGLKAITDSFTGISEELAFKILIGHHMITIDEETQEAIVGPTGIIKPGFYSLDGLGEKVRIMNRTCLKLNRVIKKEIVNIKNKPIYFNAEVLLPLFLDIDSKNEDIDDYLREEFIELNDFIKVSRNSMIKMIAELSMLKRLQFLYEKYSLPEFTMLAHTNFDIPFDLIQLQRTLTGMTLAELEREDKERFKQLDDHITAETAIREVIKKGIEPVDHKAKKWDAGYISPEGLYYALDGEISNLLHIAIADALTAAGIIPADSYADSWLERKGWVKQHGDHILFSGYDNHKIGEVDVAITERQIEVITELIRHHYNGVIWPGFDPKNRMSVLRWAGSDPLQHKLKWFAW